MSSAYGVDPALAIAVITQESGGDPKAVSPHGATGLMQLLPGTAKEVGVPANAGPGSQVLGGIKYLASMLRRYNGDVALALAAYNAGPGAVDAARGIPNKPETQAYVRSVMGDAYGAR